MDLPEITVKNLQVEANVLRHEGVLLAAESKARADGLKKSFKANAQMELGVDVAAMFDCFQQELMKRKNEPMEAMC